MNRITQWGTWLSAPDYPVIIDVNGHVLAAESLEALAKRLAFFDLPPETYYPMLDVNGEGWELTAGEGKAGIFTSFDKPLWTKREIVDLYNGRKNRPEGAPPYPHKSLSAKRHDRIIRDIVSLLIEGDS